MSNIELLAKYGDPMERAIVRDSSNELGGILAPYADIWRTYVRSTRIGSGELLRPECMPFGGSHYTALIRAQNALGFYNQISTLGELGDDGDNGALLLEVQSATSGFWWSLVRSLTIWGKRLSCSPGAQSGKAETEG